MEISSIDKRGKVLFVDGEGTTNGTEADCQLVGGRWEGTACYVHTEQTKQDTARGNKVNGGGNTVTGNNNFVQGNMHTVESDFNTITGFGAHAIRYGERVHATTEDIGRSQVSTLIFQGQTTDTAWNELYIGGVSGERFIVDESKECVISMEAYVLGTVVSSTHFGDCENRFQHATFQVTSGSLRQVGSTSTKTNNKTHTHGWGARYTVASGTPDHIKVEVQGHGETIDWTVVLRISEMRTEAAAG